jgi:predicted small lipoprotein YifL
MRKSIRFTFMALAALSLAGCGILFPTAKDRAAKNTPGFKSGYSDGCASATIQDTTYRQDTVRDEAEYKNDKNYRAGWSSGFYNCRTNSTHRPNTPGVGPIPDNSPGSRPY